MEVEEKKRRREIIKMKKRDNLNRSRRERRKIRNYERDMRSREIGEVIYTIHIKI